MLLQWNEYIDGLKYIIEIKVLKKTKIYMKVICQPIVQVT